MSKAWPIVPLGEILTERKEVPSADDLENGNIRIVAKIGFNDGKIILREDCQTKTDMILIHPGDLVVPGINAAKGAIAIYGSKNTEPIAATIHYSSYIPNLEKVDIKFLWWFLRSNTFREILYENLHEGIKTELKAKRLLPIAVPLPSFSEQRRIVVRIEELTAKIEEARMLRQKSLEEVESLLPSTLELLYGKEVIKKWPQKKLIKDKLATVIAGQHIMAGEYNSSGNGVPYLTGPADFGLNVPEVKRWTLVPKSMALPGDVLLTVKGAGVGKINYAPNFEVAIGRQLMAIRPDLNNLLSQYVYFFLDYKFKHFQSISTATTVPGFKKTDVEDLNVPVPPLPEQHRIVAYLDNLQAKVDALKHLQAETEAEIDALMPSILDKAFKGKLRMDL